MYAKQKTDSSESENGVPEIQDFGERRSDIKVVRLFKIKNRRRPFQSATTMVRVTGLEPVRRRHTPLKRACLPIPAHSQIYLFFSNACYYSTIYSICQHFFKNFLIKYFLYKILIIWYNIYLYWCHRIFDRKFYLKPSFWRIL